MTRAGFDNVSCSRLLDKPKVGARNDEYEEEPHAMFIHNKKLQYTVHVGSPNPAFAKMCLEQFGGPNGNSLPPCVT